MADPTREGQRIEISTSEKKDAPQTWKDRGAEGSVFVKIDLDGGKYEVSAHGEPAADDGFDYLSYVPTTRSFEANQEAEAKAYAAELLADSENWDDEKYN